MVGPPLALTLSPKEREQLSNGSFMRMIVRANAGLAKTAAPLCRANAYLIVSI